MKALVAAAAAALAFALAIGSSWAQAEAQAQAAVEPLGPGTHTLKLPWAGEQRTVIVHVPVTAGAGSNPPDEAIMPTRHAKDVGCDAALHVTGYYNKPTQEGLFLHYKAVAEAVEIPQILYNVPGRTSSNMLPSTVIRLANDFKNIIGIKEAAGDIVQAMKLIQKPFHKLLHFGTKNQSHTISKTLFSSVDTIRTTERFQKSNTGVWYQKGKYIVKTYQITSTVTHNLGNNDTVIAYWPRPSSSITWSLFGNGKTPRNCQMDIIIIINE